MVTILIEDAVDVNRGLYLIRVFLLEFNLMLCGLYFTEVNDQERFMLKVRMHIRYSKTNFMPITDDEDIEIK